MKKIFKFTAFVVLLLFLAGDFSSCKKQNVPSGIWECKPEPGITITLTFDQKKNVAYVNVDGVSTDAMMYLFNENTRQLIVDGNKMCSVEYGDRNQKCSGECGFVRTMLSTDSMKLENVGCILPAIANIVTIYVFNRKTD